MTNLARTDDRVDRFRWLLNTDVLARDDGARGAALPGRPTHSLYEPYAGPTLVMRGGKSNYVSTASDV
jgi:hypothetical protein